MLCDAMRCYAMLCYAMLCYAMLGYAMLCCAVLCYGDVDGNVYVDADADADVADVCFVTSGHSEACTSNPTPKKPWLALTSC